MERREREYMMMMMGEKKVGMVENNWQRAGESKSGAREQLDKLLFVACPDSSTPTAPWLQVPFLALALSLLLFSHFSSCCKTSLPNPEHDRLKAFASSHTSHRCF